GGVFDLLADRLGTGLDRLMGAGAVNDRGVVLVDRDALGCAEHADGDVFKLDAEIFADHLAAGQDGDVFEHRLAAIAEARRLDGRDLEAAAQLVDDERRQRFAFDVLGNDQQRATALAHCLENRQHRLEVRQLLLVDQDVGVGEFDRHLFRIGDEVGREVAAVELHAFNHVELEFEALGFLDRDHAFLAYLLHRFGDLLADDGVAISRDYADLADLVRTGYRLRAGLEVLDDLGDGDVDAALQVHRIHAGRDRLHAFANDRLGQNGGGGGAVAGDVVGLRGDFAQHLRAHVLELVLELDF